MHDHYGCRCPPLLSREGLLTLVESPSVKVHDPHLLHTPLYKPYEGVPGYHAEYPWMMFQLRQTFGGRDRRNKEPKYFHRVRLKSFAYNDNLVIELILIVGTAATEPPNVH